MRFLPRLELSLLGLVLIWLVWAGLGGGWAPLLRAPGAANAQEEAPRLTAWLPGGIEVEDPGQVAQLLRTGRPATLQAVTAQSIGLDLFFPHMADGLDAASDLRIVASVFVMGTSNRDSDVELFFFKENGTPLEVSIGGVTASRFPFKVKAGESRRIQTDGTGPIKVGWAKLKVSQPVGATLTFAITRANGRLDSEVGVDRARPHKELAILAEFNAASNTAMAFLNTDSSASNKVDMVLYDLEGKQVSTATETLEPGGKRAQFLTERFPSLAGRSSFQGLLVLKGDKPLAVLTLRSRGRHLTSLPAVRKQGDKEAAEELFFYRVGSGVLSTIRYQTSFVLMNHSDQPVNATLDLFQDNGTPLVVKIGNQQASTFNFSMKPKGAVVVNTSDTGAAKTGWARLKPDKALEATAIFTLLQAAGGDFLAEVGVDSTIDYERSRVFADSLGDRNTAIAISNISDKEITYGLRLHAKNGDFIRFLGSQKLAPRAHTAKFITEFFADVKPPGQVVDINEFEGRVDVFCTSSDTGCAVGTLRLAGPFLTSLPALLESHGFKPTTNVELHSELGGSMPSAAFKIQQFDNDMVLDSLEVSVPELGFDNTRFKNGEEALVFGDTGAGNAALTFGYVESVEADGSVKLNLQQYNLNRRNLREVFLQPLGTMTLQGTPNSGFKASIRFQANPGTYIDDDFFFQVFLPPNVIKLPAAGTTLRVETRMVSVSTSRVANSPLEEINRQEIVLPQLTAGAPQIRLLNPIQGRAQAPLVLQGANLAAETNQIEVYFTGRDGAEVRSEIVRRDGNFLLLDIPDAAKSGPVRIRQSGQQSNTYLFRVLFNPQDEFNLASRTNNTAVNMSASLAQMTGELSYLSWKIQLDQGSLKLTGWSVDQLIGKAKWTKSGFPSDYDLKIESIQADHLILKMVRPGFSFPDLLLKVSNRSGGGVVIENVFTSESPVPQFLTEDFKIEWETTAALLQLPSGAGKTVKADVTKISVTRGMASDDKYYVFSQKSFVTH